MDSNDNKESHDLWADGMFRVVERSDLISTIELLDAYDMKINSNKLLKLFNNGYVVDFIGVSKAQDYPINRKEIEFYKKIAKTIKGEIKNAK